MFVIGRAVHEQIHIGNTVTIKVLRLGQKHVTLGIDAPQGVVISRDNSPHPRASTTAGCELRTLIIDETPIHSWLTQKAFHAYGASRTRLARSGKEALSLLGIGSGSTGEMPGWDLIVMDLRLSDIPGLDLIRRIRASRSHQLLPIVVMSYHDGDTEVARCLEAGANAFVPKPETQESFRQAVLRIADFWSHARRVSASAAGHRAQESLVC